MLFALTCFLLIPLAHAASETLDAIDVTTRSAPLLRYTEAPVWHASEQAMQEAATPQEVLAKAPGVMFTQNGGAGGRGAFYLRGSESRHTVVLTDGMRLNDPSITDRQYDTAFLFTPFFQDVWLLRGPAPVLYGGDATAGVIELVPRRGRDPRESVLGLGAGSFDTAQGFALQDWGRGNHQGSVGVSHLRTRGFSRLNRRRHGAREADGAETTQLFQASRHRWTDRLTTDALVYGLVGEAEFDGLTGDNDDRTFNRQGTLVQTTRGTAMGGEWWLRTGYVGQERQLRGTSDLHYRGEGRQAQLGVSHERGAWTVTLGAGAEQERLAMAGLNAGNDVAHAFVLPRWRQGALSLEAGVRGEQHQRYGGFAAGEATARWVRGGIVTHAKVARGYKSPSLYQLYAPAVGFAGGNADLLPERNLSQEAGVAWKGAGEASVTAFRQDYTSLIDYTPSGARGYANQGSLRVRGLEAEVLSPEHSWGQVTLTGTWLAFSRYDTTPLRRPPYLFNAGWRGEWGAWGAEMGLRLVGGRRDQGATRIERLAPYELLSALVRWSPDERQSWLVRLGNLTDREYEDVWGYGVAPLNASLQWLGRF